jgi:hypothetical protein
MSISKRQASKKAMWLACRYSVYVSGGPPMRSGQGSERALAQCQDTLWPPHLLICRVVRGHVLRPSPQAGCCIPSLGVGCCQHILLLLALRKSSICRSDGQTQRLRWLLTPSQSQSSHDSIQVLQSFQLRAEIQTRALVSAILQITLTTSMGDLRCGRRKLKELRVWRRVVEKR